MVPGLSSGGHEFLDSEDEKSKGAVRWRLCIKRTALLVVLNVVVNDSRIHASNQQKQDAIDTVGNIMI